MRTDKPWFGLVVLEKTLRIGEKILSKIQLFILWLAWAILTYGSRELKKGRCVDYIEYVIEQCLHFIPRPDDNCNIQCIVSNS